MTSVSCANCPNIISDMEYASQLSVKQSSGSLYSLTCPLCKKQSNFTLGSIDRLGVSRGSREEVNGICIEDGFLRIGEGARLTK